MAQLAFAAAGAVVGGFFGQPAIGWAIGAYIGGALFGEGQKGPRLDDLKVAGTAYGGPIRLTFGTIRVPGDVIWAADLIEVENEESAKGGPAATTYDYFGDFAVLLCEGPITGVRRIWANSELIMDVSVGNVYTIKTSSLSGMAISAALNSFVQSPHPGIRIYLGDETQLADPLIEGYLGAGNVPAYRGRAYIVFNRLALEKYGNRIPQIEAEVVRGTFSDPDPDPIADGGQYGVLDTETGYIWSSYDEAFNTTARLYVTDPATDTNLATITLSPTLQFNPRQIVFIPNLREIWVAFGDNTLGGSSACDIYSADSFSFVESLPGAVTLYNAMGSACYLSDSGNVFLGSPSTGVGRGGVLVGAAGRDLVADLGAGYYGASIDCEREGMFAIDRGNDGSGNHYLEFRESFAGTLLATALVPDGNTLGPPQLAYDTERRRVIYIPTGSAVTTGWTVDVDTFTVTAHTIDGTGIHALIGCLYHKALDRIYVSDRQASHYRLAQLNAETLALEKEVDKSQTYGAGWIFENPDSVDFIYAATAGNSADKVSRLFLGPRLAPSSTVLKDVVSDLVGRTQLGAADIDVTALTDVVDGYAVGRSMDARSAIEPLEKIYYFDAVESEGKIKFVKRGGAVADVLVFDDLAAHETETSVPDALETTRGQDLELPNQVDVVYYDAALDYAPGNQVATRIVKPSKNISKIDVALVLTVDKAKQAAEVNLYNAWAGRSLFKFAVPINRAALEPTDVVQVVGPNVTSTMRLVSKNEGQKGVIAFEAVSEDSTVYTQQGIGVAGSYVPQTIAPPAKTILRLLDVPLLRDVDEGAGHYVAVAPTAGDWQGAQVFRSDDGGVNYDALTAFAQGATIGAAADALGDFASGNIFDELNVVTIQLLSGSISSATESQVLNGANLAVLGDEVLQFKTATLVSGNTYKLSGLLRGRRGTEWAMSSHSAGDLFALASVTGWKRIQTGAGEIGLERQFKAVTFGQTLSSAVAKAFTNNAVGLKPYAGVEVGGGKNGGGDILINWKRRNRLAGAWRDYVDVPLSEASESYEVEVLDDVGAVKRTLTATSPAATYAAADQATDFPLAWSKIGGDGLNSGWSHSADVEAYVYAVDGVIYAATRNTSNAAGIWKWNGTSWTKIAGGGLNSSPSTAERYVALCSYGGELHTMLVNGGNFAECWKFNGTDTWTKIGGGSTATNGSWSTSTFFRCGYNAVSYGGNLLVSIGGASAGDGEVWSWNGSTWTKIGGDGVNSSWSADAEWTLSLCLHNGKVYAGNSFSAGDADVWEWNGSSWTQVGGDGTGWAAATFETVFALASDGTNLYAGLGQTPAGDAEVWSWNGSTWTKIGGDGVNSSWNTVYEAVYSLLAHSNGRLYAGIGNSAGDAEVWEWNGSSWSKIGGDTVNGGWDSSTFEIVAGMAELNGKLYAGLGNSAGDGDLYVIGNPANPVPNPLQVQIYQLSATVGRGTRASGNVSY